MPRSLFALCWLASCDAMKVTVVGGAGFVGSRVCKILVGAGAEVTSLSKSGKIPEWAASEEWTRNVRWNAIDLLDAEDAAIDAAMNNPTGIVSCLGVVDSNVETLRLGNGVANINAFASAKRAGVKRAVYISVASEVATCEENWLPFAKEEFAAYFEGKSMAEDAAAAAVGQDATKLCIVKPSFIYGGETFEVPLPGKFVAPRVSSDYGYFVEELHSISPSPRRRCAWADQGRATTSVSGGRGNGVCIRRAGRTDKGPGDTQGVLDGTSAIKAAAGEVPASESATDSTVRWTPWRFDSEVLRRDRGQAQRQQQ